MPRFGLPLHELPQRALDAVDVAERGQGRTVLLRDGQPVAALVSIDDLDRADPPDPGLGGSDPLLALCGTGRYGWFVEQVLSVYGVYQGAPVSSIDPSDEPPTNVSHAGPLPPRGR